MTWRNFISVFALTFGVFAFPSATQVAWVTTAEARPIPERLPISPERLSLETPETRPLDHADSAETRGP